MDIASLRSNASLAVMDNVMNVAEQQDFQLIEMLQQSPAPHPTSGVNIDLKV